MIHIPEAGGKPVVQVCTAHCCLYRLNQKHCIDCGGAVIKEGMLSGETTHLAALGISCLPGNCSCTYLDHLISRRKINVRDGGGKPTDLNYQNPIQSPIPHAPQKLSSRRAVNNTDEHTLTGGSNAQGGRCWIPSQWKIYVITGVRHETTYISGTFGGIGGRADMMSWMKTERTRRSRRGYGPRSLFGEPVKRLE